MSDELQVRSAKVGQGDWTGTSVAAIALKVEAESVDDAHTRVLAFTEEVRELAAAHPGIELLFGRPAIAALEISHGVAVSLERKDAAEQARRQ
jgi:hypothetical protein